MKKNLMRIVSVLIIVCVALSGTSALASSNRLTWQSFPLQKRFSYSQGYTYEIQRILSTQRYYDPNTGITSTFLPPSGVDGGFGPQTEAAVMAFQTWVGVTSDGKVGSITWGKLYDCLAYSSTYSTSTIKAYCVVSNGVYYLSAGRDNDYQSWCYFLSNSTSTPHWFHYDPSSIPEPLE